MRQTTAGGGFSGVCDINHVKQTLKECAGLEGKALEACWADSGCDVNVVTEHYLSVAGLNKVRFCMKWTDRRLPNISHRLLPQSLFNNLDLCHLPGSTTPVGGSGMLITMRSHRLRIQ